MTVNKVLLQVQYAGSVALLCNISREVELPSELLEVIENTVYDWCATTSSYTYRAAKRGFEIHTIGEDGEESE